MKNLYTFFFSLVTISLFAASGDIVTISAHQDLDIVVQGRHDVWVDFPDASENFQLIEMFFEVGCYNNGVCSHWDYDVDFHVGQPTGTYDSTIASFDTISTSPLVVDTNWNAPFEIIIWHEMGRFITPYATYMDNGSNGFDNGWEQTFKYDVTDFRPLLTDSVPVRIHFHGWQNGFRGSIDFQFTEGNPTRDVLAVDKIYTGGTYNNFAQFDSERTPDTTIVLDNDVEEARLKVTVTGHGQAGEFTPIDYTVKSDGQVVRVEDIWRDDCDQVHVHPQGGTWIYSRANWCPGDAVEIHEFELTDHIQEVNGVKTLNMDIDFMDYAPSDAASYSLSAQLVTYKEYRRDYDAYIDEIIAPSNNYNYTRFNPICDKPIIRIKNLGKETMTSCQVSYWLDESNKRYYMWEGSLAVGEFEDVSLPDMNWANYDSDNPVFYAELSYPNGIPDQFPYNNRKSSEFVAPDMYDINIIEVYFRANDKPQENSYLLRNYDGDTLSYQDNFNANAYNNEDILVPAGCYVFEMWDYGTDWDAGDGLSWWVNTQNDIETAGSIGLRNGQNNQSLITFNPDFGRKIYYPFLVKDSLTDLPIPQFIAPSPTPQVDTAVVNGITYWVVNDSIYMNENEFHRAETILSTNDLPENIQLLSVYPNPSNGLVNLYVKSDEVMSIDVSIYNMVGQEIKSLIMQNNQYKTVEINQATGVYFIQFDIDNTIVTRKVVIK